MEVTKQQSLEELAKAFEAVEEARFSEGITPAEQKELEAASLLLRDMERELINSLTSELIAKLKTNSKELNILAGKIKKTSAKLDKLAKVIEKAAKTTAVLLDIIQPGA